VLDGATVIYGSASELKATLEYDFSQEKDFSYQGLSMDEIIHHLAVFISRIWQIQMRGISEMHLFVRIIQTCKKGYTKQQNIWKCSWEICF